MAQVTQLGTICLPMRKRPAFVPKTEAIVAVIIKCSITGKRATLTFLGKRATVTMVGKRAGLNIDKVW